MCQDVRRISGDVWVHILYVAILNWRAEVSSTTAFVKNAIVTDSFILQLKESSEFL